MEGRTKDVNTHTSSPAGAWRAIPPIPMTLGNHVAMGYFPAPCSQGDPSRKPEVHKKRKLCTEHFLYITSSQSPQSLTHSRCSACLEDERVSEFGAVHLGAPSQTRSDLPSLHPWLPAPRWPRTPHSRGNRHTGPSSASHLLSEPWPDFILWASVSLYV